MRKLFYLSLFFVAAALTGCDEENILDSNGSNEGNGNLSAPIIRLTGGAEKVSLRVLVSGEQYVQAFETENTEDLTASGLPEGWTVAINKEQGNVNVTAPSEGEGESDATLQLTATGKDGQTATADIAFHYVASFDDPEGAFVLNEGNMTTENGSLIYITPQGHVVDNAFKRVNGKELGNVAQDMCFCGGKVYIISQNGDENPAGATFENAGVLVVADARTLKQTRAYSREDLGGLDWPTHVAAIDEQHVYIRDNAGIWRLDTDDNSLAFIGGSGGAPKAPFAIAGGRLYTYVGGIMCGLLEIAPGADEARRITDGPFWGYGSVSGISAADDGHLWLMVKDAYASPFIVKYDVNDASVVEKAIGFIPESDASGCKFAACKNLVYYADGTSIYRLNFDSGEEEMLVDLSDLDDNARQLYNGLGVNPVTGHVYINTIKGLGNFFTTNSIWEFDFDTSLDTPVHKFDNYTRFPAGIFFNNK